MISVSIVGASLPSLLLALELVRKSEYVLVDIYEQSRELGGAWKLSEIAGNEIESGCHLVATADEKDSENIAATLLDMTGVLFRSLLADELISENDEYKSNNKSGPLLVPVTSWADFIRKVFDSSIMEPRIKIHFGVHVEKICENYNYAHLSLNYLNTKQRYETKASIAFITSYFKDMNFSNRLTPSVELQLDEILKLPLIKNYHVIGHWSSATNFEQEQKNIFLSGETKEPFDRGVLYKDGVYIARVSKLNKERVQDLTITDVEPWIARQLNCRASKCTIEKVFTYSTAYKGYDNNEKLRTYFETNYQYIKFVDTLYLGRFISTLSILTDNIINESLYLKQ